MIENSEGKGRDWGGGQVGGQCCWHGALFILLYGCSTSSIFTITAIISTFILGQNRRSATTTTQFAMKTNIILYLLLSSVAATSASDTTQEYNDTSISAEASINDIGDVELEDPKTAELINTIKEAMADGSFGDEDIFENYAANNGFGEELVHSDIRFTSKGAIDITKKPMPDGVPEGFPKTRRAYMALRYSKDEKKKEMRFKDLYDDLVANEDEWLEFLDHLQNSEFAYECLRISYEYAQILKKTPNQNRDMQDHFFEMADIMKKLINVQQKYVGSISEYGRELFEEIEFLANYFIWNDGLWKDPYEYGRLFKKLLAYEV